MLQDGHSRISIMRYSNNFVWLCTPVYTRNNLIVLWDKRNRTKKIVSQNPLNKVENKLLNWVDQNCIHKNKLCNAKYMPSIQTYFLKNMDFFPLVLFWLSIDMYFTIVWRKRNHYKHISKILKVQNDESSWSKYRYKPTLHYPKN